MASLAKYVVFSILAATGLGQELHTAEILSQGASFESYVAKACAAEVSAGYVVGGEVGDVAAGLACVAEGSVVGAVVVAGAIADVGVWAGCDLWAWATSSSTTSKRKIVAPPGMLRRMRLQFTMLKEPFSEMGAALHDMTKYMNEAKWDMVAAKSTVALGAAKKFSLAMHLALKQGSCEQPTKEVVCPGSYPLLNNGDTKTCQDQPLDCYDLCCRAQDAWCEGDSQCKRDRGCGPTLTPAPTFIEVNCEDLENTAGDFAQATKNLEALHDCAIQLKPDEGLWGYVSPKSNGCGTSFEQNLREMIQQEFANVQQDLDTLTELYWKDTQSPATALVDKRSNVPSNLAALDNAPWQHSYAQVSSSCDSMKRKVDAWLECKGSIAGGKMQVGEMPISLFLIVLLLVVGCCFYFRFIDSARRENATEKEGPLLGAAPRPVEKARPKVFVIFLVVYTLSIGLVALLTPSPTRTPASTSASTGTAGLCQQNLQHVQNKFDICDDFASALQSGSESGEAGLEQLLSNIVAAMAAIDKDMMPK